jgi:hypothetical protein
LLEVIGSQRLTFAAYLPVPTLCFVLTASREYEPPPN